MSLDFHLITRRRPSAEDFGRAVTEAAGREVGIAGDFGDPDDYLNVSAGDDLWIEVEPPGHVEVDDLRDMFPEDSGRLPEPDDEGCLWFTAASVPQRSGADVIGETFERLARDHEGIVIEPG